MNKVLLVMAVSSVALLGACASKGAKETTAPVARTTAQSVTPSNRVVYFDFNSAEVNGGSVSIVKDWAAYLASNPGAQIQVEGHTDAVGTDEYNQVLGERRAGAVKAALVSSGANTGQIKVVSHGEARPATEGSTASARAKNRRVEIVD